MQVLDVIDCTGSGDVDVSTVVKAAEDGCIKAASGRLLTPNSDWVNPSGDWHVGLAHLYSLFPRMLTVSQAPSAAAPWRWPGPP
jgi:tripeptidyl-peptidase-2